MIEGCYPRHICIDLTHFTSQSKIFDTAAFLQAPCQVLFVVPKIRTREIIGASTNCDGGISPLAQKVKNFKYFVDILFAPKFSVAINEQYPCQFSALKKRGETSLLNHQCLDMVKIKMLCNYLI